MWRAGRKGRFQPETPYDLGKVHTQRYRIIWQWVTDADFRFHSGSEEMRLALGPLF